MNEPGLKTPPLVIGIAGGTSAGKTTVARHVCERYRSAGVALLDEDSYYLDRSRLTAAERERVNYDEPAAIDHDLLRHHLEELMSGREVEKPLYSFETHTRLAQSKLVAPARIIVVEGLFTLSDPGMRGLLTFKVYVDVAADVRFARRLCRDIAERGRTVDSIVSQYFDTVRAMHYKYVEPGAQFADVVLDGLSGSYAELDARIDSILAELEGDAVRAERAGRGTRSVRT